MACRIDTSTTPEDVLDLDPQRIRDAKGRGEERVPAAGIDLAKRVQRQADLSRQLCERNADTIAVRPDQRAALFFLHCQTGVIRETRAGQGVRSFCARGGLPAA